MAKYVNMNAAIDAFYEMRSDLDHLCTVSDYVQFLKSMSDTVEIVRCKDYIYSQDKRACNLPYGMDGYCPLGKGFDEEEV